jgi:hypothetical protein
MPKALAWTSLGMALLFVGLALIGVFGWESLGEQNARMIFKYAAKPALGVSLAVAFWILASSANSEEEASGGIGDMVLGALWCVGGIIVTVATYRFASENGGTYVVTWGAIVFGAMQFFRGFLRAMGK